MFYRKTPIFIYPEIESQLLKWNPSETSELLQWLFTTPKTTTYRINLLKTGVDEIKAKVQAEILKKDKSAKVFTIAEIPELICIPPVQNLCTEPTAGLKEIIVDGVCGAAILRGAHIYAPGVIAMPSGTKNQEEINVFADLSGKCKKGTNTTFESPLKTFIGIGVVQMQRYQLYGQNLDPRGVAIEMIKTISGVPSIGDLSSESLLLQNFPSIICSRVLDPQPNETILDMCSAPGNKTTHIAELMKDTGIIIALDKTESKIQYVRKKIENLKSVKAFVFDSTKSLSTSNSEYEKDIRNGPPFRPESFDRILLDAPCSALGNRPVLVCKLSSKMLKSYPAVQKKLFTNAVGLLKPGGTLVYSTCTVTEAENEDIVSWAKTKFPEIDLVQATPMYGGEGLPNVGLNHEERKLVQRFAPSTLNCPDSVGFFIAKFMKCNKKK